MDPYDLKPMGNAKVPVNLEFFLQDCNNLKPKTTEIDVQTDRFQPVAREDIYIPKKTGIDVETQILDWELFDFDREVKPIAKVITQKTLIQTALEIEEEEEMRRMHEYKTKYGLRRKNEKAEWRKKHNAEIKIIQDKNKMLDHLWARDTQIVHTSNKLQAFQISKSFLRRVKANTLVKIFKSGIYPNTFDNQLKTIIPQWLLGQVKHYVARE